MWMSSAITDYNLLLQNGWVIKCNLIIVKGNGFDLTTNSNLSRSLVCPLEQYLHVVWNVASLPLCRRRLTLYLWALCALHSPAASSRLQQMQRGFFSFLFFFFIMQRWNSSHRCCIDTPVTALGPERRTVSVQPNHPNINRHTPSLPCTTLNLNSPPPI